MGEFDHKHEQYSEIGHTHIEADIVDLDRMRWRGPWQSGLSYQRSDVVVDEDWLMVANKATIDRAAPIPSGQPYWLTGLGDSPAWSPQQQTAPQVITGLRYTVPAASMPDRVRYWVPSVYSGDIELWVVDDPTGATPAPVIIRPKGPAAGTDQWIEVPVGQGLLLPGQIIDVLMLQFSDTGPDDTIAYYDYRRSGGDPGEGQINHQGNQHEMRINYTDENSDDWTTELQQLVAGDQIIGGGITWTLTENPSLAGWGITCANLVPVQRLGSNDQYTFTFRHYSAASSDYVQITGGLSGDAALQGFQSVSGYGDLVLDQNAYGIDVREQKVIASPDWDAMSRRGFS